MHPANSVITFTTLSGAGYGLLFWLGLSPYLGMTPNDVPFVLISMGLALGLISIGLLSSTLHLRRPERAWRAFSQWRSSWLSREGVMSLLTFVPAGAFGLGWLLNESTAGWIGIAGLLSAIGAAATVSTTAMIYASLKPIRQWHHPMVLPLYLVFAAFSGLMLLLGLLSIFSEATYEWVLATVLTAGVAWGLKILYWRDLDARPAESNRQTATGLTGHVTTFDPPHTEANYLMKEMGYHIARKHAYKLRRYALISGGILPVAILVLAFAGPLAVQPFAFAFAALFALIGIFVSRWLFFAEAEHTVTLYYSDAMRTH